MIRTPLRRLAQARAAQAIHNCVMAESCECSEEAKRIFEEVGEATRTAP